MSFEDLPNELLVHIFEYVPKVCTLQLVSKQFSNIIEDIRYRVFKNPNRYVEELSPPVYLLFKYSKYRKLIWDRAISRGNLDLIIELDKLGYNFDIESEMVLSAKEGHKNLIEFFISKGAKDWDWGLGNAAYGGHKYLVDFFIEKGAKEWNWGLGGAAKGGHKDLVDFFIEKGADDWKEGMICANEDGHKELVKFFEEKLEI